jgi:integrase
MVTLDADRSKNGEPRTFPMTTDLRALLKAREVEHDALKRRGQITPLVFFREVAKGRGGPTSPAAIISINKAWQSATKAAGLPGRIPHDLRRSAIRTFVRRGISEHTSMKLSGHLTPSVFRRYDIISEADLKEAAEKLNGPLPQKPNAAVS